MNSKEILRKKYLEKRNKMNEANVRSKSLVIQNKFLESALYKECNRICIYMDFNNEVKTDFILNKSLIDGKEVYIPKINDDIMQFYQIDKSTRLCLNKFKIKEPVQDSKIFKSGSFPSIFIVPGVTFSKGCYRIGYGGGYYDKWIEQNPNNIYIGLAYDFQIIDGFELDKYDQKVNYIITETCCLSG